jgi:glycosyltransferase involved in cell wall biosynthesis
VVASSSPGNRDLVLQGRCGWLVESAEEMAEAAVRILENPGLLATMRLVASEQAAKYQPGLILDSLLDDMGLSPTPEQHCALVQDTRKLRAVP